MFSTIGRCIIRIELQFLKRRSFYSSLSGSNSNEFVPQLDENSIPQQKGTKFLKIAILGLPNAGKSTLVNALMRRKICPTSEKVHTTMHKAEAVYTENDTQLVFLDTPGITTSHERKIYKLDNKFIDDAISSIKEADILGILQDVSNIYLRSVIHDSLIELLQHKKKDVPLILIFNKVDKLKNKSVLLNLARQITSNENIPKISDIFMVSALNNDGVDDIRNYLLACARDKEWQYQNGLVTDQPYQNLVLETVRARLLDSLYKDIPYKISLELEHFDISDDDVITTTVKLKCRKRGHASPLLKRKGTMVKMIARLVESDLRDIYKTDVFVHLNVTFPGIGI